MNPAPPVTSTFTRASDRLASHARGKRHQILHTPSVRPAVRAAVGRVESAVSDLVYYVSGHGFGHAVRSAEVIRVLLRRRPVLNVHLRTTAPAWLFPPVASCTRVELDVGVVQSDALHFDQDSTLRRAADLARDRGECVAAEVEFLRSAGAGLVVGDVPPPAFVAAQAAGVPSIAVANFGWDWIYEPFVRRRPEYAWLLDWLRDAYGRADLLLRLPLHGDLSAFRAVEDVPMIVRPPSVPGAIAREQLGLHADDRVVMLGFGGLGLNGLPVDRLAGLREYTFLATEKEIQAGVALPPNVRLLPIVPLNYNDFIAASDAVVSKPGYGMVTTCLALRVPLLCTDRGGFPEDDVLLAAIEQLGHGAHIPPAELLAGNLEPYLAQLLDLKRPWQPLRTDGADVVAQRLLTVLDTGEVAAGHVSDEPQADRDQH